MVEELFNLGLKGSQISGEENQRHTLQRWKTAHRTRVLNFIVSSLENGVEFGLLWGKHKCSLRSCLILLSCSMGSTLGVKFDLILA